MQQITGVLLVNLGTPDSPAPHDVYRYLIEFLTDERVIDVSWVRRQLLVRGLIVPLRYKQSAKSYQAIWTLEGSPLMVYGKRLKEGLQERLGDAFKVELAMRYQNPGIEKALNSLLSMNISRLIVLPLFPQYASATTGSVQQKVMELLSRRPTIPKVTIIDHFFENPAVIHAFASAGKEHAIEEYDHILFSFHGLPQRQLYKADQNNLCQKQQACCLTMTSKNRFCYSAQCYATAKAIASNLRLTPERYSICFQSRLGKEPWIQPYASDRIEQLASGGCKRLLVFCPSFVCDCLETIFEIGVEYNHLFKEKGGEDITLVRGLNDDPVWFEACKELVLAES